MKFGYKYLTSPFKTDLSFLALSTYKHIVIALKSQHNRMEPAVQFTSSVEFCYEATDGHSSSLLCFVLIAKAQIYYCQGTLADICQEVLNLYSLLIVGFFFLLTHIKECYSWYRHESNSTHTNLEITTLPSLRGLFRRNFGGRCLL